MRAARIISRMVILCSLALGFVHAEVAPADTPVVIKPLLGATDVPLLIYLKWAAATGADHYRVLVFSHADTDSVVVDVNNITVDSLQTITLCPHHTYYWAVGAVNVLGTISWTKMMTFTTAAKPGAPTLIAPVNGAVSVLPQAVLFQVSPFAPDTNHGLTGGYHYQIFRDADLKDTLLDSQTVAATLLLSNRLSSSATYYWRAKGIGVAGESEDWSATFSFTTAPAAPSAFQLISPLTSGGKVSPNPVLLWHKSTGAVKYAVSLNKLDGITLSNVLTDTLTDTSLAVGPLATNASFTWSVTAINPGGTAFANSSFQTLPPLPGKPSPALPAKDAANVPVSVALTWHKASDAAGYRLQVSTSADFGTTLLDTSIASGDTAYALAGLAHDVKLYWRVRARNEAGDGDWSDASDFATIVALPAPVTLVLPHDGDTLRVDSARAVWHAGTPKADRYVVQVSRDAGFAAPVTDTVSDTTDEVHYAAESGLYYWRVKAHNAAGWGEYSAKRSVLVLMPATAIVPAAFSLRLPAVGGAGELRYALPKAAHVAISVYDMHGRLAAAPVNALQGPGVYTVKLDATLRASGWYVLDFKAGEFRRRQQFRIGR